MFHVGKNGQTSGPFSMDQLMEMARTGALSPDDLVWGQGMADWQRADSLPEVQAAFPAGPPGSPPPPSAVAPGYSQPPPSPAGVAGLPSGPATNTFAIVGLVCGIISVLLACCCYGLPFNILGIVFSAVALNQIKESQGRQAGRGMALGGLWCGIASIIIAILLVIFVGAANMGEIMKEIKNEGSHRSHIESSSESE